MFIFPAAVIRAIQRVSQVVELGPIHRHDFRLCERFQKNEMSSEWHYLKNHIINKNQRSDSSNAYSSIILIYVDQITK